MPPAAPNASRLMVLHATPDLVERTYEALLDAIVCGELAPGERHTQESLADRLGVSRQPILQALLLLKREGLIKDEPGRRGVEVQALTPAFVQHLYLVRGALDALAARSAAYRPRPELREPGMALIRAGRASSRAGTTLAMIDADLAFHRFIYEAAHNPLLTDTARIHWLHTRRAMGIHLGQPVSVRTVWARWSEARPAWPSDSLASIAKHRPRLSCDIFSKKRRRPRRRPNTFTGDDCETDPRPTRIL